MLCRLHALVAPFPDMAFIIKGNAKSKRISFSCPFPALITPFLDKAFIYEETTSCINEETIGAINEAAIGAFIAPINPSFYFFLFHVLWFQSDHQLTNLNFLVNLQF